jgi:4a-hydroxytetrahydrobiopterin dehydratase
MELADRNALPCEHDMPPLSASEVNRLLEQVPGWFVDRQGRLSRSYRFENFKDALSFINHTANIADREQHHPDFCLQDYNLLSFMIHTYCSKGLTENDFILAAKIGRAYEQREMAAIKSK